MKFGIFFELSVPRPFDNGVEAEVYHNALEQVRVADQVGFDTVWAVEHHFLEEYSHCSSPELFLTAAAMQTTRIRVGHGAVVCVPQMNHPIRVAERAAVLDILSNGRLELGTARSSTWTELGGFEVDPDTTKKTWDEFVRVIPKMWKEERFSHDGVCFSMPERAVLPKPIQDPHPPLWVTVTSPGTELDAADRGLGALGVATAGFSEQERRLKEYRRRIQFCDPVGECVNDQVATLNFLYCDEDIDEASRLGNMLIGQFGLSNSHLLFTREAYPTKAYGLLANISPGGGRRRTPAETDPGRTANLPEGMAIGDPDRIAHVIREWESLGVDQVNFMLNALECIPQEKVLNSLRLFGEHVIPKFQETD